MSRSSEKDDQTGRAPMNLDAPQEVWLMVEGLDTALEDADISEADGIEEPLLRKECDWCGEVSSSGYFVAVRDQNYQVCPICWGRSPAYIDSRRAGYSHEDACRMLSGNRGNGAILRWASGT